MPSSTQITLPTDRLTDTAFRDLFQTNYRIDYHEHSSVTAPLA